MRILGDLLTYRVGGRSVGGWTQEATFEGGVIGTYPDGFDAVVNGNSGTVTASTDAKKNGSYGAAITIAAAGDYAFGRLNEPAGTTSFECEFWINRNTLAMGAGEHNRFVVAYDADGAVSRAFELAFTKSGANFVVRGTVFLDGGGSTNGDTFNLGTGWHKIGIKWKAATAVGANNGEFSYSYDGASQSSTSTLDNDTYGVDEFRIGIAIVAAADAGTSGVVYYDDVKWK